MEAPALLLSRVEFAATVSFHIIPSLTIGLAAWLFVLDAMRFATGNPVYRRVFEFWLAIFGVASGMGVPAVRRAIRPYDQTGSRTALQSNRQVLGWGRFVLPIIVAYTNVAYAAFRGRVSSDHAYH